MPLFTDAQAAVVIAGMEYLSKRRDAWLGFVGDLLKLFFRLVLVIGGLVAGGAAFMHATSPAVGPPASSVQQPSGYDQAETGIQGGIDR